MEFKHRRTSVMNERSELTAIHDVLLKNGNLKLRDLAEMEKISVDNFYKILHEDFGTKQRSAVDQKRTRMMLLVCR